jgi:hypothetical protein
MAISGSDVKNPADEETFTAVDHDPTAWAARGAPAHIDSAATPAAIFIAEFFIDIPSSETNGITFSLDTPILVQHTK